MTQVKTRLRILWVNKGGNTIMKEATYTDAVLTARWLRMSPDFVWATIKGMMYTQYFELRIAVLNSPPSYSTADLLYQYLRMEAKQRTPHIAAWGSLVLGG